MNRTLLALTLALSAPAFADGDAFARFDAWAARYRAAPTDDLRYEGLPLAVARRAALFEQMQSAPADALAHFQARDGLPEEIAAQLELPLSGIGRYEVLGRLKRDGRTAIERAFRLGDRRWFLEGYGSLLGINTVDRFRGDGFALGEWCVLDDRHVQRIGGNAPQPSPPQPSPWTVGTKKLRFIRVDFSDQVGDPLSQAQAQNLTSQLNTYLRNTSYAKTQLTVTLTNTLRMPRTKAAYNSSNDTDGLLQDARAAANSAGPAGPFDLDVLAFASMPSWDWAGLGFIGQSGAWLNGAFSLGVIAHEVGHNYGLYHANFWQSNGESIIGSGQSLEYGNPFEIMGDGDGHYNAWYKDDLDWFNANEVAVVTSSNTFRVYDLELGSTGGTHALRVPIGSTRDYWVEFRPGGGGLLARGASINWGYNHSDSSNLLDMTPWTQSASDSPLVVGRTFSDFTTGIHITPTGLPGTMPASLDVTVNRGLFPTNHAPTVMLACPLTGSTLDCTATAMDQDGDTLAYLWDFGDGQPSTNQATQSRSVAGARDVLARVTVSDMKGGTATASTAVRVGNPSTLRISGTVTENGTGVEGVRVFSGSRMTWTSSDGTYTLVGVSGGSYPVSASKPGWTMTAAFTNPVQVQNTNVTNINFTASRATYTISGRVTSVGSGFLGATVSAGIYSTVTNSNGDFTLTGVPNGAYILSAVGPAAENFIAQGFTNPVQVNGQSLSNRNFVELVFPLRGKVTGQAGPHTMTDGVRTVISVVGTGAWDWVLPKVPPGTWNVSGTAAGQVLTPAFVNPVRLSSTGTMTDATGTVKMSLDFVAATGGPVYQVSGYVDEAGGPGQGIGVDAGVARGATDSRGIYMVQNLPAGTYTLTPERSGYLFAPATLDVTLPNPDGGVDVFGADFTVTNADVPPGFAFPPHATPSPVPGTTCNLVTLGHDPVEAESTLRYTWSQAFGAAPTVFSRNGDNGSKSVTVTFSKPGAYAFDVEVRDIGMLTSTASVTLLVLQTTTSVSVTPATSMVNVGSFKQLVAAVNDQFGEPIDFGGEARWTVMPDTCGTITQTGKLTALVPGACTITAEVDGKMGSATVMVVVGAAPRVTAGPTANPNPVTGATAELSVTADDDEGEAQLSYTWSMVNGPAGVAFGTNGSNAAKLTTATFTAAGTYDLQVEVRDSHDITTSAFLTVQVVAGGVARVEVSGPMVVTQGMTAQFVARGRDIIGAEIPVSGCTWSTTAGSIDANGLLTAQLTGTVTATCSGLAGSANVTVMTPNVEPPKKCGCGSAEGALALLGVAWLLSRPGRRRA